jgi:peptide/nickel transport system permease protein
LAALILRKSLIAIVVLFGVSTLTFSLSHFVPGDPVEVMLGESASVADRDALRQQLGLDRPIAEQWLTYMRNLLRFDLGVSLHSREPISAMLAERFPWTLKLAAVGLIFAIMIAFPLGVIAALSAGGRWDNAAMLVAVFGVSVPNFLLGPLLIVVFALWLGWFPISGIEHPLAVVLPALTLGASLAAILARMIRAALLDVLTEPYLLAARARGLMPNAVLLRHALPNAALPILTVIGLQLGVLLGGAVITEMIFDWPGIGHLTVEAIQKRDYPVVQACVLLISASYVVVNVLTDILYALIDPRVEIG